MSNLTEHCLDGWDALTKKTNSSLDGVKGLQSLLKHLSDNFHKFSGDLQGTCAKYKNKKIELMEGSVKAAVIATVDEFETLGGLHRQLADELDNMQKEVGNFLKEREKSRKRLLSEASNIRKGYESSIASLKKAREAYHKAAKEVVNLQNSGKAAKVGPAEEKAKSLDKTYQDQLITTNDKQYIYYTQEQPVLLAQFQQWEEARIDFVKKQMINLGEKLKQMDLNGGWERLVTSIGDCSGEIDEKSDMESYARSIGTDKTVPPDFQYEAAPEGPSLGAPGVVSTHDDAGPSSFSSGSSRRDDSYGGGSTGGNTPSYAVRDTNPFDSGDSGASSAAPAAAGGDDQLFRALYDYEPTNEGEMVMHSGETLRITEKDESGWWYAIAEDGREGFVPQAYVEPI